MKPRAGRGETARAPRHLVVKLAPGWHYASEEGLFVGPEPASPFRPATVLPKGSRVEPMVPDLGNGDAARRSPDERNLARYVHVILPPRRKPQDYLERVRSWPGVEEVRLPPEISLP